MKILIDGLSDFYGSNIRIINTLMKRESEEEFPEVMKWSVQMLYLCENEWVEICRIDNYLHEGQHGSHIHYYGRDDVRRIPLSYKEAGRAIKEIGARILKERFSVIAEFGR